MKRKTRNTLKIFLSAISILVLITLVSAAYYLDNSADIINDIGGLKDWIFNTRY